MHCFYLDSFLVEKQTNIDSRPTNHIARNAVTVLFLVGGFNPERQLATLHLINGQLEIEVNEWIFNAVRTPLSVVRLKECPAAQLHSISHQMHFEAARNLHAIHVLHANIHSVGSDHELRVNFCFGTGLPKKT